MRIDSTARSSGVTGRSGASRSSGDGGFFIDDSAGATQAGSAAPVAQTAGIDALLALQSAEEPLAQRRKKAVRRANALLDTLETIKADLLLGQVSEGRLNQLMVQIGQLRERGLADLDAVLDDIELRARVELAKFGRYPS
jgi:parvulin-like peptidyl-prolyl isomerase